MKTFFPIFLFSPDDSGGGNNPPSSSAVVNPPAEPKEKPAKKTSDKDLETRFSLLEDKFSEVKEENKSLRGIVEGLTKIPSTRQPGKNLLDEVSEFLGLN